MVDRVDGAHVPEIVKKTRALNEGKSPSGITQLQEKPKEVNSTCMVHWSKLFSGYQ